MTPEQLQTRLSQLNASLQQLRQRRYVIGQQIEELQGQSEEVNAAMQQMFGAIQMVQEFINAQPSADTTPVQAQVEGHQSTEALPQHH